MQLCVLMWPKERRSRARKGRYCLDTDRLFWGNFAIFVPTGPTGPARLGNPGPAPCRHTTKFHRTFGPRAVNIFWVANCPKCFLSTSRRVFCLCSRYSAQSGRDWIILTRNLFRPEFIWAASSTDRFPDIFVPPFSQPFIVPLKTRQIIGRSLRIG